MFRLYVTSMQINSARAHVTYNNCGILSYGVNPWNFSPFHGFRALLRVLRWRSCPRPVTSRRTWRSLHLRSDCRTWKAFLRSLHPRAAVPSICVKDSNIIFLYMMLHLRVYPSERITSHCSDLQRLFLLLRDIEHRVDLMSFRRSWHRTRCLGELA